MLRVALALVPCFIAWPASGAQFDKLSGIVIHEAYVSVVAFDTSDNAFGARLIPDTLEFNEVSTSIDETGIEETTDPTRVFGGHTIITPADLVWTGGLGASEPDASEMNIEFDSFELVIEGDAIAYALSSGQFMQAENIPSVIRGSGTFSIVERSTPFSFSLSPATDMVSHVDPETLEPTITWTTNLLPGLMPASDRRLLWVKFEGVDTFEYIASLTISATMTVPEPGSALLLGLGLAGLAMNRRQ